MKKSRIYTAVILIFLALMFAIEQSLPKKFDWKQTYSQYDHQPFGCAVFDDIVAASLPDTSVSHTLPAYSVSDKTLWQWSVDSTANRSLLIVADYIPLSKVDLEGLERMLERGSKIMLVASNFSTRIANLFSFKYNSTHFSLESLRNYISTVNVRDTLYWVDDSVFGDKRTFLFYPHLFDGYFYDTDSLYTTLSMKKEKKLNQSIFDTKQNEYPCAVTREYGRGRITLVSNPLIFTNYGILDKDNSDYIFRLLNQLAGLPIIRLDSYAKDLTESEESPLRYVLSQPSLRWGIYMTIIVSLLFMLFTARRQQRPIPVIRRPANNTVAFVQLIGTLYFRKKDHAGLVMKKFIYFAEKLRRTILIDIEDEENDSELAGRISQKTGISEDRIYRLLQDLRPIVGGNVKIDEEKMKRLVMEMNEIINHL